MKKIQTALLILFAGALLSFNIVFSQNQVKKPDIIIVLADDMDYSDPGCCGGEFNL